MPKLLIIDDERDFLETAAKRFAMRGYENLPLEGGEDIEKILRKNKDIDVVILDLKMPGVPGEEVLKRIKQERPEVQVIILTGHGSTEQAIELAKHDAFTYLQKPIDIDKLVSIVDKARTKATLLMAEENKETKGKSAKHKIIWSTISVLVGLAIALMPTPEGLDPRAQHYLGLLMTIIFLWVSEAVPIGATALVAGAGMILFGIQSPSSAWTQYANPAVMFVLMIIMFGVILNEVGVAQRILHYAIKIGGTNVLKFSLFIALVSSTTSAIFHDATITIIFLFAVVPVFMKMGITPDKSNNLSKFFTIMIPLTASAGGFGTVLGGGRNPLAIDYLTEHLGIHIGFLDWMLIQYPMVILSSIATWAVCYIMMPPKMKELPADIKTGKMAPMGRNEKGVVIVFILAFIAWTLSDFTNLHLSVVAALALLVIFAFKFVDLKIVLQKFSWEAWLVFGAGVSLGAAMLDTGAGKFLADQFFPLLGDQGMFVQYYGIAFFGSFLSSFMSNSAAVALCNPILDPMAVSLGLSPLYIILSLPVTTSFIMLIIGCPPSIIAYSTGYFNQLDFIKVAIPKTIVLIAIMVLCMMLYYPFILGVLGYQ
jgi:solute carrier family 13 (sodium-dependent dicarboxylate transporter), member 2/3/5